MYDASKVITGLIIFLIAATFPFWVGSADKKIEPVLAKNIAGKKCVESKSYMRANHMQLLDAWRNSVVRDQDFNYVSSETGETHRKSLSKTCMNCHVNKKDFCDKCHDYTSVQPYCWSCHVEPKVEPKEGI